MPKPQCQWYGAGAHNKKYEANIMKEISAKQKNASLILKAIVIISALAGTILSFLGKHDGFMAGKTIFMFFTIQSNILIAIISAIGLCIMQKRRNFADTVAAANTADTSNTSAAANTEVGANTTSFANGKAARVWYVIKFVGTVSITLTGVVFVVVLAPTLGVKAWNIHNILTHVVVPLAAIADFFVMSGIVTVKKINVLFVTIPPIIYAIYAGIGFVKGWTFVEGYDLNYPYFFLNWGSPAGAWGFTNELPFMGCAWWILAILVFLLAIGSCYLTVADRIARKRSSK